MELDPVVRKTFDELKPGEKFIVLPDPDEYRKHYDNSVLLKSVGGAMVIFVKVPENNIVISWGKGETEKPINAMQAFSGRLTYFNRNQGVIHIL